MFFGFLQSGLVLIVETNDFSLKHLKAWCDYRVGAGQQASSNWDQSGVLQWCQKWDEDPMWKKMPSLKKKRVV